jgi:predicted RND superfamily exporter protein
MSAADLVAAINKAVNYDGASYYEIPTDPKKYGLKDDAALGRLVGNYLALLSGSISDYANDPLAPTAIKASIQLRTVGNKDTMQAVDQIHDYINAHFPKNKDITVEVAGEALIEASLANLVVQSQLISLAVSLVIVFLILAYSNKSFIGGIFGVIPLAIAILVNFAVMGFAHIKLNLGTSLVASLAVGIGIDYTIHMMETAKQCYAEGGGQLGGENGFLLRTFKTAGLAIIINAVSVGLGFLVLVLSQFVILQDLGLLIFLTMVVSALVSLTVIPVLITMVKPKFIYGKKGLGARD